MRSTDAVTLVVLDADHPWRSAVLDLAPAPAQEVWSSRSSLTLPEADADPHRTPFAISLREGHDDARPIGFGALDRVGILAGLVDEPGRAVLLRGFYVDGRWQGRGYGTAAARQVAALAADLHDDVDLVVLTVNESNPAAVTAYRRAGFVETGARYLGGDAGPQHVLVAAVRRQSRAAARST